MIIGVTGLYASGKDTVADYLVKNKSFDHFSLSDILRQEARRRGIEANRQNLIKLGTDLKIEEGHEVLAKRALEQIKNKTVVSSVRHPREVVYFQNNTNFILFDVFADPKIRFDRMKNRNRGDDNHLSFEEFIANENIERQKGGGQEFDAVIELANFHLDNNKDFDHLYKQIDDILVKIEEPNVK